MKRLRLKRAVAAIALAYGVLTSGPAHSEQVVLAVAAAGAGYYLGPLIAPGGGFFGALASAGAAAGTSIVLGGLIGGPGKQQSQPTFQAEARDRLHLVRSAVESRRMVYGTAMVSGPLVYAETTGGSNQLLHLVIPLAGHEVDAIGTVWFNDEALPLTSDGLALGRWQKTGADAVSATYPIPTAAPYQITVPGSVAAVSSVTLQYGGNVYTLQDFGPSVPGSALQYSRSGTTFTFHGMIARDFPGGTITVTHFESSNESWVRVRKHLGTADQVADADLVTESAGGWTAAHRLRGIAYLYVRLEYSGSVFPGGIPNIKALVRGKKLYDPRSSPSYAWSDNWALVMRDYLTSDQGLACEASEIDDTQIAAAANVCDELVALEMGSPATHQPRYTVNGTVNLADRPVDIIKQLCTAAAGAAVFTQGVWKVFPGAYVTPTVDIDESWLRGGARVLPRKPRRELYNGVRGTFSDPDKFFQPTDFPPVDNSTYVTQDGGEPIWRDIELPYTNDTIRAQRIAKIHLEKSRQSATLELPCNLKAFQVAVWDTVRVSIDRLGYSNKVFQVLSWKFSASGGVDLVLQEEASAVYDWNFGDAAAIDAAPDTNLPDPFDTDLESVTVTSGTADLFRQGDGTIVPRAHLRWTAPANPFLKYYEIQSARLDSSPTQWVDAPDVAAPAIEGYAHPVEDGIAYDFRVRVVTTLGNEGAWVYVRNHTVIGKTADPSDVTGFTAVQQGGLVVMGCNAVADKDLDTIEIRYHDEGEDDYDDASPFTNILRGETVTSKALPPGTWELLAKAKDTSGNYSANAARVTITVTSEGFTTIEQESQAPAWNGALTNMVKHWTGVLVPESQSLASALGEELFNEFVPNACTDCYYEAAVIDKGIDATARIYGDIVSVLGPGETGIASPALEVDTRTSSGSFDGFEGWTVGAVNFRYLKARIHVDTTIGKPVISQFSPTIDAEARDEEGTYTAPAGGSVAVTFATPFHVAPVGMVSAQGSGDVTASYASLSTTGFTGYFKTAGVAGAGTASYRFTGA